MSFQEYTSRNRPIPLLPKLKGDSNLVKSIVEAGEWSSMPATTFKYIAKSFEREVSNAPIDVVSIPTAWAQPLSVEMAVHDSGYPERDKLIGQWEGMLAAIALSDSRGLNLKVQELDLYDNEERLCQTLHNLFPSSENSLYALPGGGNPWSKLYVYTLSGKPVGMTSPSTLVVPAREAIWNDKSVEWWDEEKKRLTSPHAFLSVEERGALRYWLDSVSSKVRFYSTRTEECSRAVNRVIKLLDSYRDSLHTSSMAESESNSYRLHSNLSYFGPKINVGSLEALTTPVRLSAISSEHSPVCLVHSTSKTPKKDLLVAVQKVAKQWKVSPREVRVIGDKTLADVAKINSRETQNSILFRKESDLFLPELYYFSYADTKKRPLKGTLHPKEILPLEIKKQKIVPLFPLKPLLLEYIDSISLVQDTSYEILLEDEENPSLKVSVSLSLRGIDNDRDSMRCQFEHVYPIIPENKLSNIPILQIWPFVQNIGWKNYYAIYAHLESEGPKTFSLSFPQKMEAGIDRRESVSPVEVIEIYRLSEYPEYMICKDNQNYTKGLLFPNSPKPFSYANESWVVGFDFGTSSTNVFLKKGDRKPEKLNLNAASSFNLPITDGHDPETALPLLYENFISHENIFVFPIPTVLTTKSARGKKDVVLDGRVYPPQSQLYDVQSSAIETNLKWNREKTDFARLFIKDLALKISALAVRSGVSNIQWAVSYPGAFSRSDVDELSTTWAKTIKELNGTTGIQHELKKKTKYARSVSDNGLITESVAVGNYFKNHKGELLTRATCIDIGGGTSDISIWENQKIIHQCSVRLAGHHILNNFLRKIDDSFVQDLFSTAQLGWESLNSEKFNVVLDHTLRSVGIQWLYDDFSVLSTNERFLELKRLIAIGISGLYYYVGICLKALYKEGKYVNEFITPVYVAGNGSYLFHWLASNGDFSTESGIGTLLTLMITKGSGFDDSVLNRSIGKTELSDNPKDEVAHGLVLEDSVICDTNQENYESVIAGLDCTFKGIKNSAVDRLTLNTWDEEGLDEHSIELEGLAKFLYEFDSGIFSESVQEILPLSRSKYHDYQHSDDIGANEVMWNDVKEWIKQDIQNTKAENEELIRLEPPFILALKALLTVLGKDLIVKTEKSHNIQLQEIEKGKTKPSSSGPHFSKPS